MGGPIPNPFKSPSAPAPQPAPVAVAPTTAEVSQATTTEMDGKGIRRRRMTRNFMR